jgi:hypothetical protein
MEGAADGPAACSRGRIRTPIYDGSKQVDIGTKGESLVFTPTRNGGTTGPEKCYHDLPAASVAVPLDADDNSLAMALAEAWAGCI